jgi:2-oxoglutarate ferredoxin oxidoreductase subunit alpha
MSKTNDFVIQVATVNGSGSQSSNNILVRSLFRMGIPVGGKNLFPSNIQGLPTWFTIRAHGRGFTSRRSHADIFMAMNAATAQQDLASVRPEGFFFYNSELKIASPRTDITMVAIPFRDIVTPVTTSIKLRKLLTNMAYVGILAELLKIDDEVLNGSIAHQFKGKDEVMEVNRAAVLAGRTYARENLSTLKFPYRAEIVPDGNKNKILIDGNSAGAIGLVYGGCSFVSWYPITPSTSLVENFAEFAESERVNSAGERTYAIVQAEDELAAISMVLGAGWMGARAMTATSGPGVSLMSEAAGLSYYAEIPAVIWDVQRVGPSTGLPTRTMQGDLLSSYYLSHGDAKHVVLLPGSAEECFEFGQTSFDLSERLQTLVIVLSDLDLGMNFHIAEKFTSNKKPFDRGKVLSAEDLEKTKAFSRYKDVDGDGIPYRTLPGTQHPLAAYFTRGTGHDEDSRYSEDSEVFKKNLDRLNRKWETAKTLVPAPVVINEAGAKVGLLYFGTTAEAMSEIRSLLNDRGLKTNQCRIRALPMSKDVVKFIEQNDTVFVIEQNRDGQLLTILRAEFPEISDRLKSIRVYDGLPLSGEQVASMILEVKP